MSYGKNIYGTLSYGTNTDNENQNDLGINLMQHLPPMYQRSRQVIELQDGLGKQVNNMWSDTNALIKQCFISTSTWGLDQWEKLYGIQTDTSKSYEIRREILLAKLRGAGTTTKERIKNVAIAFSGGEVDIQEYTNEHRFVVQFIGIRGIPQNMAGLIGALDEIKPAHLAYSFKYTYTSWQQINMTWNQAKQKTWGNLRIYEGE